MASFAFIGEAPRISPEPIFYIHLLMRYKSSLQLFFAVICFSACDNVVEEKTGPKKMSVDSSTTRFDSLGYPSYYTHPEIQDIAVLRSILDSADVVFAFNFNGYNGNTANVGCEYLYKENDSLCGTARNMKRLTEGQVKRLVELTTDTATYSGSWSGLAGVCWLPHAGFGFWKRGKLIAQVNVCFLCGGIRTKPLYRSDGLSQKGRKAFYEFVKSVGLTVVDGSSDLTY
jgi:hypothetical protein